MLSTENMGGVVVTPSQLSEMQAGDYILHARDGVLSKVSVEKTRMPLDPQAHYQGLNLVLTPDRTIYAVQHTIISKSTDGGKAWEHLSRDPSAFGFSGWLLQANRHGQLINVSQQGEEQPTTVWISDDEGQTWEQTSEIDVAPFQKTVAGASLTRLTTGRSCYLSKDVMIRFMKARIRPMCSFPTMMDTPSRTASSCQITAMKSTLQSFSRSGCLL